VDLKKPALFLIYVKHTQCFGLTPGMHMISGMPSRHGKELEPVVLLKLA
jgi:hypothetical protein